MKSCEMIKKYKNRNGYEYIKRFNGEILGQSHNLLDPAWMANEKMIGILKARNKYISCNAILIACNDEKVQDAIKEFYFNNPAIIEALKDWDTLHESGSR